MLATFSPFNAFSATSFIVVKRINATASLNKPSPKITENKTGC
jgi:hypothetical protein